MKHLWWGRIPLEDIDRHVLVRGVGLSALGKLDMDSIKLPVSLSIPHHEGAGGEVISSTTNHSRSTSEESAIASKESQHLKESIRNENESTELMKLD
jgi:hypothetical protein